MTHRSKLVIFPSCFQSNCKTDLYLVLSKANSSPVCSSDVIFEAIITITANHKMSLQRNNCSAQPDSIHSHNSKEDKSYATTE